MADPLQYHPYPQEQAQEAQSTSAPLPPPRPRSTTTRTTVASLHSLLPASTVLTEQSWRRFGKARRRQLIESDNSNGENFRINPHCDIDKYFALAERVIHQFRALCNHDDNDNNNNNHINNNRRIEDAYVLGHRLVTFLSTALPRHPAYHASDCLSQRHKCVTETVSIRATLKQLAVAIDEEHLNRYVEHEYEPPHDDLDDSSTESGDSSNRSPNNISSSSSQQQQPPWESFDGWSASGAPGLVDTDESSYDDEIVAVAASSFLLEQPSAHDSSNPRPHTQHNSNNNSSFEKYHAADPELDNVSLGSTSSSSSSGSSSSSNDDGREQLYYSNRASPTFDVDNDEYDDDDPEDPDDVLIDPDEDDDDQVDPPLGSPVSAAASFEFVSSFLEKIAEEDVHYETDSEAADSWAPDGGGDSKSTSSATDFEEQPSTSNSSSALVCDPARCALGEILNRHADLVTALDREIASCCSDHDGDGNGNVPPPPPHNSPDDWTGAKQVGLLSHRVLVRKCNDAS